jgi:hypothetical protein
MKIAYFTSNQPRHIALANRLAEIGEVFAIQEMSSPTKTYKSEVMNRYFSNVVEAERKIFGTPELAKSIRSIQIPMESVSAHLELIPEVEAADYVVVFGSSWIRKPLADALVEKKALNLHMGIAPFYRGAACNFWASYDGNHDLVGGTIHHLATGLDNGEILFHTFPVDRDAGPFLRGMLGVRATHDCAVLSIAQSSLSGLHPVPQRKELEIRYTRSADFTDAIAAEYLTRDLSRSPRVSVDRDQIVHPYHA